MLITNLGSLKAELGRYMFQQRFAPDYDTAVQNFEAAGNRRLRVRQMENFAVLTLGSNGHVDLPADYLAWRSVVWHGSTPNVELDYIHPAYWTTTWLNTAGGPPKSFGIRDGYMTIRPLDTTPDGIVMDYYQKIPTILGGTDNATNWLLTEHPDCYLFGSLAELFALGRNREAAELYKARRDETFAEIIRLSSFTTGATSKLVREGEFF